jgi:3-hydroxyisobutyrate dehydrogenase
MGFPMARNALGAGLAVRAWNRSAERARPLGDDGATVASSPREAAEGADLVVTVLSDADAVLAVADGDDGALAGAGAGAPWVQMSTIGIDGTERCAELAERRGIAFVDAPVLGTKAPAEQGKLVVLASGPDEALDSCQPLFDAVGERTMRLGEAGTGTRLKLVTNAWVVSVVESLAETLALAQGLSLDRELFFEAIGGGGLDLPYARMKGEMMMKRSFEPSFALELASKDSKLVLEAAERHGLDLPALRAIAARMAEAVAAGHGADDLAATYLVSAPAGD